MDNTIQARLLRLSPNAITDKRSQDKARDLSLDIVAGVLIIWMMLTHAAAGAEYEPTWFKWADRILYFFMPWFFFKAGMFFKAKPRREFYRSNFKRLIVPFLVFSLIGYLCWLPGMIGNSELSMKYKLLAPFIQLWKEGSVTGNIPLWFLLSLFIVKALANEAMLRHVSFWITGALGLIVGFALHFKGGLEPLWIANSAIGLAFFILGYWLHSPAVADHRVRRWLRGWMFYLPALTLFMAQLLFLPGSVTMRSNGYSGVHIGYGVEYLIWFVASTLGCLLINKAATWKPLRYTGLHRVGRDSMGYLAVHQLVINLALLLVAMLIPGSDGQTALLGCVALGVIMLPPLNMLWKRLGWI